MTRQVLEIGDKFHVVTRRMFQTDIRRHFVGEIINITGDLQELKGYAFILNSGTNTFKKRPEQRARVMTLGQPEYIVNKLPEDVNIDSLEYSYANNRLILGDGAGFTLDINEFGPMS